MAAKAKKVGTVGVRVIALAVLAYPVVVLMSFGDINDQIAKIAHHFTGG